MQYSHSKEINTLVRDKVRVGWVYRRGGKHGRLQAPGQGWILTVPSSPGDRRSWLNFRSEVRRLEQLSRH